MKDDTFQGWLQDRHSKMTTPSEVVNARVQKVVGSPVGSAKRLVVGQDNEVYDITTTDGQHVITRISHRDDPRFEGERWALDAARKHGAPTPKVFLIEKVQLDDHSVTFCIEEKLPGMPLDTLLQGHAKPKQAIAQLGELLSQIHSVKVNGFGYLQEDGKGWKIPFSKIMLDLLEKREELRHAAEQWSISFDDVEQALQLLQKHSSLYNWDDPSLTHGDIGPDHVLVDSNQVTGVIDFQECSGNHPIFDLVHWDINYGHLIPVEDLTATYKNKVLFDDTYEALFHLVMLRQSLWMLMVRVEQDNPHDVDVFKRGLQKGLRFFSDGR
jgi:aminoglycoside phosphotransferase (APT) family kinase protein